MAVHPHPLSGEPCTRQRAAQLRNLMNGHCLYHSQRPVVPGTQRCAECLNKRRVQPRQYRPSREVWGKVDWDKPNWQIAKEMCVSDQAVSRQRRLHAEGVTFKYKPFVSKPRPRQYVDVSPEDREQARIKFSQQVATGRITAKPCAVCGCTKTEGHHFDYRRPLEVIWLCKPHHGAVHAGARQLVADAINND
jgi:hypothetical protein